MDVDITFASGVQRGNVQHAFRQDAQERVVGLRLAPVEFVVDDRVPQSASGGDPIVDPQRASLFFELHHRSDVIVDHARLAIAALAADQIRTAEFVIAMKQNGGTSELRGDMEGQRCLSRAGRSGEMHGVAGLEIGESPFGDLLNGRRGHERVARTQGDRAVVAAGGLLGDRLGGCKRHDAHFEPLP